MKYLIVKTSSLGDIVQTFPVLNYLKQRDADCRIDWVAEQRCSDLTRSHPLVDRVLTIDTRQWKKGLFRSTARAGMQQFLHLLRQEKYDVVFDLQGNIKSGLITFLSSAPVRVGFDSLEVAEWPNVLSTNRKIAIPRHQNRVEDYLSVVRGYFEDALPYRPPAQLLSMTDSERRVLSSLAYKDKSILVCPGSAWRNKQLTLDTLEGFLRLLQKKMGCSYLFAWGSNEEKRTADALQSTLSGQTLPRLSLPTLQNLMPLTQLVVAMDSLPLHLAGLANVPTFAVFGPSLATVYNPKGHLHISVQGLCPYEVKFDRRCPKLLTCTTGACIHDLTPEMLDLGFQPQYMNKT